MRSSPRVCPSAVRLLLRERILALATSLGLLCGWAGFPDTAGAWGDDGHRIVCEIAQRHLDDTARSRITAILATAPEVADWSEACTWAHSIQDEGHPSRAAYGEWDPYHFLNIDPDADQLALGRDCPDRRCLVNGIIDLVGRLRSRSATDEQLATPLMLLAGLVGDLHQPLHVSARDRNAGLDTLVNFGIGGDRWLRNVSLYEVWDRYLVEVHTGGNWRAGAESLASTINEAEVRQWVRADLFRWANESRALSEEETFWVETGMGLGTDYVGTATPFLEQQLRRAGVRLAAILNLVLSGDESQTPFYVGNAYWDVFYYPECEIARRIPQDHLRIWEDRPAGRRLAFPCPSL
ncbi:MAG: S1/P1 nuclease [Myxococcota bacterium]